MQDATSSFPRAETLYVGGPSGGSPRRSIRVSELEFPLPGRTAARPPLRILLLYNVQSGKVEPLLAESYKLDEDAIEVVMNPAARWNDGRPVTGLGREVHLRARQDIQKPRRFSRAGSTSARSRSWMTRQRRAAAFGARPGRKLSAPRRVRAGTSRATRWSCSTRCRRPRSFPARHRAALRAVNGDIDEFLKLKFDQDPVVSGPYRLSSYSSEKIVARSRRHLLGQPALLRRQAAGPKYIVHPIYKSNDHFSVALQQGRLDASSCFVPRIWLKQTEGRSQLVRQGAVLRRRPRSPCCSST